MAGMFAYCTCIVGCISLLWRTATEHPHVHFILHSIRELCVRCTALPYHIMQISWNTVNTATDRWRWRDCNEQMDKPRLMNTTTWFTHILITNCLVEENWDLIVWWRLPRLLVSTCGIASNPFSIVSAKPIFLNLVQCRRCRLFLLCYMVLVSL